LSPSSSRCSVTNPTLSVTRPGMIAHEEKRSGLLTNGTVTNPCRVQRPGERRMLNLAVRALDHPRQHAITAGNKLKLQVAKIVPKPKDRLKLLFASHSYPASCAT